MVWRECVVWKPVLKDDARGTHNYQLERKITKEKFGKKLCLNSRGEAKHCYAVIYSYVMFDAKFFLGDDNAELLQLNFNF